MKLWSTWSPPTSALSPKTSSTWTYFSPTPKRATSLALTKTSSVHPDWTTCSHHFTVIFLFKSGLIALAETENKGSFINIAALFDHEECGSESAQGAGSNIIMQSLRRIYDLLCEKETAKDNFYKTMQRSFLISADMAHGIHPNYSDKHQVNHQV